MCRFVLLLLICLTLTAYEVEARKVQKQILAKGAKPVKPGQFPFLTRLHYTEDDSHACGASIISPRVIITAAHCLRYHCGKLRGKEVKPTQVYAVVGTINLTHGGVKHTIERFVNHEKYNYNTFANDIRLLKTTLAIQFSELAKPVELVTQDIPIGAKLTLTGWGETVPIKMKNGVQISPETAPEIAQYLSMDNLSMQTCRREFTYIFPKTQICTDPGMCIGDSGGPLIYRGHLAGIAAMMLQKGYGDGRTSIACGQGPDVYLKISAYVGWIRKHQKLLDNEI